MSNKASGTDNQQGSPPHLLGDPSETTRRPPTLKEIKAYVQGAAHDGTFNVYNQRFRIAQKGVDWLQTLKWLLKCVGASSWIYREGKNRNVYVLETCASFIDAAFNPLLLNGNGEIKAYLRGFFDAEGGIPRKNQDRFYIQLVQNDRKKLRKLKIMLRQLGIETGIIHNPSHKVDPDYWRMFIRARSWKTFVENIGSWHPRKQKTLKERWLKI